MTAPRDWTKDRETCDKATPGPWLSVKPGYGQDTIYRCTQLGSDDMYTTLELKPQDARFIAAARLGWPAALDEIERLQGLIDTVAKAQNAWDAILDSDRYYESHELDDAEQSASNALAIALDELCSAARKPEGT